MNRTYSILAQWAFELRIIEVASGLTLHREGLKTLKVAHGTSEDLSWGTRIPYFDMDALQLQVVDGKGRVVLDKMLGTYLNE